MKTSDFIYVALTRAQFKLYLPYFPADQRSPWLGPVRRFVSQALSAAFPQQARDPDVAWLAPDEAAGDPNRNQAVGPIAQLKTFG